MPFLPTRIWFILKQKMSFSFPENRSPQLSKWITYRDVTDVDETFPNPTLQKKTLSPYRFVSYTRSQHIGKKHSRYWILFVPFEIWTIFQLIQFSWLFFETETRRYKKRRIYSLSLYILLKRQWSEDRQPLNFRKNGMDKHFGPSKNFHLNVSLTILVDVLASLALSTESILLVYCSSRIH